MSIDLSAFDELYKKKYADAFAVPPGDLSSIDVCEERLISPFASFYKYLGGGPGIGKFTIFSGMYSTGKTSLAMAIAGSNPNMSIAFIDGEFNWTDASYIWAEKMFSIPPDRIRVFQPDTVEQAGEMIYDFCESFDIIILDGLDAIPPRAEMQGAMDEKQMGEQARAYKKILRKSMGRIYRTKTCLIATNHLYDNIGNSYEPIKEPGGKALSDFASQKLWLGRSKIGTKEEITGQNVNATVKKDKLYGTPIDTKFSLEYKGKMGFDYYQDLINVCVDDGLIDKAGSWYSYNGSKIGQGSEKVKVFLQDNPDVYENLFNDIKNKYTKK